MFRTRLSRNPALLLAALLVFPLSTRSRRGVSCGKIDDYDPELPKARRRPLPIALRNGVRGGGTCGAHQACPLV